MKMPTLNPKKDSISIDSTSNNSNSPMITYEHHKNETHLDLFFQMRDLPVFRRIEALKLLSQELKNDMIGSTLTPNSSDHNHKAATSCNTTHQDTFSPDDVLGNLRTCKGSNRSKKMLEQLLSKGSSLNNESDDLEENILPNQRKGQIKSKKDFNSSKSKPKSIDGIYLIKDEKDQSTNRKMSNKINKQSRPRSLHIDDNRLDALGICKSINLQEKSKQKMYSNSQKARVHPTQVKSSSSKLSAARTSLNNAAMEYSKKSSSCPGQAQRRKSVPAGKEDIKTTKVFLSEKQSGVIVDCGMPIPCAPPATPTPEILKKREYVPSLQDVRAQRMVREKLQTIEDQATTMEKKKIEESLKIDRKSMQEKRMELKRIQRLQIYALNKVMTDLEYKNFVMFMRSVE